LDGFSVQLGPLGRQGRLEAVFWGRSWDASGALGAVLGPFWPLLGRPGPLLGASWGSFWAFQGADLDDLDDVCGATWNIAKTLYFTMFLAFQSLPERFEITPKSARGTSWTSCWDQRSVWRDKLSYIRRCWTPCRGTPGLRNPAQLAQTKSRQAKIPSNCSYMD